MGEVEGWEEHKQDTKQKEKEQFMRVLCVDEASNLKGARTCRNIHGPYLS